MQLVINTYGAYLLKSGNCFLVKRDEKSFEVAVGKVNSILITTAAYITTDAIKLAGWGTNSIAASRASSKKTRIETIYKVSKWMKFHMK